VIGQYYNFQGILHTANMMNTMTNMFMVFKMINIYWFVSNSNEMVRQHIGFKQLCKFSQLILPTNTTSGMNKTHGFQTRIINERVCPPS
jgi:hypothetical protein